MALRPGHQVTDQGYLQPYHHEAGFPLWLALAAALPPHFWRFLCRFCQGFSPCLPGEKTFDTKRILVSVTLSIYVYLSQKSKEVWG